ncbi:hypothetical protein P9112_012568 [Eukaryota sp. TZLM1-RC]
MTLRSIQDLLLFCSDLSCSNFLHFLKSTPFTYQSDTCLSNLLLWGPQFKIRTLIHDDHMFLVSNSSSPFILGAPLGPEPWKASLSLLSHTSFFNPPLVFERFPVSIIPPFSTFSLPVEVSLQREHFDYVYELQKLSQISLWKRKKRQRLNKVLTKYIVYVQYFTDLNSIFHQGAKDFQKQWIHGKPNSTGLHSESSNLDLLFSGQINLVNTIGVLMFLHEPNNGHQSPTLTVSDDPPPPGFNLNGFALFERLPRPFRDSFMAVVHVEKANSLVQGCYQALCYAEALVMKKLFKDVGYVNREQDLGLESLRVSKTELGPSFMIEKGRLKASNKTALNC